MSDAAYESVTARDIGDLGDAGFNAAEKYQCQIPALQLLVALGFQPLSQAEADQMRGGRQRNVTLDDVLVEQLLKINRLTHRGREYPFNLEDAHEAVRRLKPTPDRLKGLKGTNQDIYDTLVFCFVKAARQYDPYYADKTRKVCEELYGVQKQFTAEQLEARVGFNCTGILRYLVRKGFLSSVTGW